MRVSKLIVESLVILWLLSGLALWGVAQGASLEEVTLHPIQDTWITEDPEEQGGAPGERDETRLWVRVGPPGGWPLARDADRRTLIQFDFSQIPEGAQIQSAILRLYAIETSFHSPPREYTVHRITQPWDEKEATWGSSPAPQEPPALGWAYEQDPIATATVSEIGIEPRWIEWDVTSDVWPGADHNGWMIKDRYEEISDYDVNQIAFCANEMSLPGRPPGQWIDGVDCRPQLVVTYTIGTALPSPPCPVGSHEISFTYDQFNGSFEQDRVTIEPFTIEPVFLNDEVPYRLGLRVSATFTQAGMSSYMFTMMEFAWDFTYIDPDPTAQDDQYWEGTSPDEFTWEPLGTGGPRIRIYNGRTRQDIRFLEWHFCVETSTGGGPAPPSGTPASLHLDDPVGDTIWIPGFRLPAFLDITAVDISPFSLGMTSGLKFALTLASPIPAPLPLEDQTVTYKVYFDLDRNPRTGWNPGSAPLFSEPPFADELGAELMAQIQPVIGRQVLYRYNGRMWESISSPPASLMTGLAMGDRVELYIPDVYLSNHFNFGVVAGVTYSTGLATVEVYDRVPDEGVAEFGR